MNIKRAKQEIKDTIEAYLLKDEYDEYVIPRLRQRPILLLGAPGIGKTQIMEQIARESGIALVAYTITHHTRQSALGLPFLSKEKFDDREFTVTEYTMSEIVASIYQKMRDTGLKEGILFIDEINCVSETLAPAMLQFLQYKTFGSHEIPSGWIIVAAGNPPEYNKSVREFDVVTMDRVKKIEVEPDYDVWKEYALSVGINPAVISYLDLRPGSFYKMETTVDGVQFATPRGWEDLSTALNVYEKLGKKMDRDVVIQYIQEETIAKDFANYLELFRKYNLDYQLDDILSGKIDEILVKKAKIAPFDERFSVVSLLLDRCRAAFGDVTDKDEELHLLYEQLCCLKEALFHEGKTDSSDADEIGTPAGVLEGQICLFKEDYSRKKKADLLTRKEDHRFRRVLEELEKDAQEFKLKNLTDPEKAFDWIREKFDKEQDTLEEQRLKALDLLEHAFDFLEAAFGNGQEMVYFITDLNTDEASVQFLQQNPCERYIRYNRDLLIDENSRAIKARLEEFHLT